MDHMPVIDFGGLPGDAPARPRPLVVRMVRAVERAFLRYRISSTQRYLDDCARDGILVGHVVDEWRWEIHDMRLRLAELEGK